MFHANGKQGQPMIVLTEQEYRELLEEAGDVALAHEAEEQDLGAPRLTTEQLRALLDGTENRLAIWRRAAGLTIAQLAEKAGVRAATISDVENGKIDPRVSTVKAIAGALRLDIDDIV